MSDEVEITVCCDALADSIDSGGIHVVEGESTALVEVIPDSTGKTGIAINFCPFCGEVRPSARAAGISRLESA